LLYKTALSLRNPTSVSVTATKLWAGRCGPALGLALLFCVLITLASHAQNTEHPGKPGRKLVYEVAPEYPPDLRRARIGGMVRLNVGVTAQGTVDSISVVGGNPILVETTLRAVKRWKWAPADSASVVPVNAAFDPAQH
jgi:TonB family protein